MANKYTDEMVASLENFGNKYDGSIPYADVTDYTAVFNKEFETDLSQRSIAGKLRYMKFNLDKKVAETSVKKYTEAEEETIRNMCSDPDNLPYLEAVADAVGRDTKSVGGKLISMKIYGVKKEFHVEKDSTPKLFTPEDEATIVEMVNAEGDTFVEDLAEAVGKTVRQVRGKLAGMRVKGVLTRNKVAKATKIYTDEVLAKVKDLLANDVSLEDIANDLDLKLAGLKSIAAKKGLVAKSVKAKFWIDERKDELASLIEEGKNRLEIADTLKTTIAVIAKQAKAMGLDLLIEEKEA